MYFLSLSCFMKVRDGAKMTELQLRVAVRGPEAGTRTPSRTEPQRSEPRLQGGTNRNLTKTAGQWSELGKPSLAHAHDALERRETMNLQQVPVLVLLGLSLRWFPAKRGSSEPELPVYLDAGFASSWRTHERAHPQISETATSVLICVIVID